MAVPFPRDKMPNRAGRPTGRMARQSVSAQGQVQTRSTTARGIRWEERWPILKAGEAEVERLLAFIERHARLGTLFWVQHPTLPGARNPSGGTADENLIRDAAMDTDTDGDGVVDGFDVAGDNQNGWTASLDGTENAQKFSADGTGTGTDEGSSLRISQRILRVFPGDEILLSVEAWLSGDAVDLRGVSELRWHDADDSLLSEDTISVTSTTQARRVISATAPDDTALVGISLQGRLTASGGSGDVFYRQARLLRASSDPAVYANPHVSGAGQTGDTLATAGWPASTTNVVRAGDLIRIGGSGATLTDAEADEIVTAFRAAADADSDSNGDATLTIEPETLSGNTPPDGAALRLQKSRIRAKIVDYTMPEAPPSELMGGLRVTFLEAP